MEQEEHGLAGVLLATDLAADAMPELQRPETAPPLLSPAARTEVVFPCLCGMSFVAVCELRGGVGPVRIFASATWSGLSGLVSCEAYPRCEGCATLQTP